MTTEELQTKLVDIWSDPSLTGMDAMRQAFALGQASMQPRPDLDSLITENAANRAIIDKQAAELAALKEQVRWRPVTEKPSMDGRYLVYVRGGTGNTWSEIAVFENTNWRSFSDVLCYMPLPPAPDAKEGK